MRKINVLEVIATLGIGGTEKQLVQLVKNLDRKKYNITVCCLTRGGPLLQEIEQIGIEVVVLNKRYKFDFFVIFRLASLMRKKKTDLIHTYMFTSNTFGRLAAILAWVPIVISSERNVDSWKKWYHRVIDRVLSRFTDKIIANAHAVRKFYIEKVGINPKKILTVYNGIDLREFEQIATTQEIKRHLNIDSSRYIVGSIGRLVKAKGYEYYIQAACQVLEKIPQTTFLIIGKGEEGENLKRLAERMSISDKVVFIGEEKRVRNVLEIIDVFVSSSLREGHSNVILEAMAMGKPVVATRVGGNPETIVGGQTGILVPPKDFRALARGIIKVLQNEEISKKLGEAAKERIREQFTIEKTIARIEGLYDNFTLKKLES